MPRELLKDAQVRAERAEPAVRAAALLHIARVMQAFDTTEADRMLHQGVYAAQSLEEPDRSVLLTQAVRLAAAVSPSEASRLARSISPEDQHGLSDAMLSTMLRHEHIADAIAIVTDPHNAATFPFAATRELIGRSPDDATRLRVLRAAIHAFKREFTGGAAERSLLEPGTHFIDLFTNHWSRLPVAEARDVVRDLVRVIRTRPDAPMRAGYNDVRLTSTHAAALFRLLSPLRHLDPELTASLLPSYPELQEAAVRYPFGPESQRAAMEERARREQRDMPSAHAEQPALIAVGDTLIPIVEAMRTEFADPFAIAGRAYAADTDARQPNDAPQECWPSAEVFRTILFKAGQHEGRAATRYLDRVPDPALRLFAQIELAAALAGLPQIGGRTIVPGPYGFRRSMAMRAEERARHQPAAPPVMKPPSPFSKPRVPASRDAHVVESHRGPDEGPSGGSGPEHWVLHNVPLRPVLAELYGVPETRIELMPSLEDRRYDLILVLPQPATREVMRSLMREGLERAFSITHRQQLKDVDVVRAPRGISAHEAHGRLHGFGASSIGFAERSLEAPSRMPEGLAIRQLMDLLTVPSAVEESDEEASVHAASQRFLRGVASGQRGMIEITDIGGALTIGELCEVLEIGLDRPVIDETGSSGTYALNVRVDIPSTRELIRVLADRYGLITTPERREVLMMRVAPREPNAE